MHIIEHNLLPKQRLQKKNLNVSIDLYDYTYELYKQFISKGIIERVQEVPQLGLIRVNRKLSKSRYDYIMLQLYLHKIIREDLNSDLQISYNNKINLNDFMDNPIKINKKKRPTVGDLLQMLTLVYNIGHFYNTFTSSRAVIMYANEDEIFKNELIRSSKDKRFQKVAKMYIENRNYHRLHLLNSILILEMLDQKLDSVRFAQELLYAYINKEYLSSDNKLNYIFETFKKVRDISYIAYDLQISNTPLIIDLCDRKALGIILRELLSFYNDQKYMEELFKSTAKLLDDTIYNENSNAICYYQISKKMFRNLENNNNNLIYYDLWNAKNSILNKKYSQARDYDDDEILKLTFESDEKTIAQKLLYELEHTNNIRVGYYDRYSGEMTILVSIKKRCLDKKNIAFKVLNIVVKYLRKIKNHRLYDTRFLLVTKFFLYYFFNENRVHLEPTIDNHVCVVCTRGNISHINELNRLLKNNVGTEDDQHEVEFIVRCLRDDGKNDVCITVPSSIVILEKDNKVRKICEFDGIIIYPNRKENQIILLEAKNTSKSPSYAKKCLFKKLDTLKFDYNEKQIITDRFDSILKFEI